MKKYYVTFKVEAKYVAEVEAKDLEEAMKRAKSQYGCADFGEASDIDAEIVAVESHDRKFLYER